MYYLNDFSSSDFVVLRNLTTYDYIVKQRELAESAARQYKPGDMENASSTTPHRGKARGAELCSTISFYYFKVIFNTFKFQILLLS